MAGKGAILAVKIISDASEASKGFDQAESRADRFARGLDRASAAAGAVLVGVGALAVKAFNSASELQQQAGAVEAVFGAEAAAVQKLADTAADRVGLAASEYDRLASLIGSQLGNAGVASDQLVGKTEDLVSMGADLAAQFGGSTSDAVSALSSLLRGERDPIERYAVSINQAAIDAKLAATGLGDLEGQAKKNAEAQATLTLLTEQTASAHGAFAREADTAAGQQQRATAQFENASAALGTALLPLVSQLAEKLAGVAKWAGENSSTVQILVGVLALLAVGVFAVNGAVKAWHAMTVVATGAQWLWNAAMSANPIVLIVIAIAAVIAIVVVCYQKFEWFRNIVDAIGRFFARVFDPFVKILRDLWNGIANAGSAWDVFKTLAMTAINIILAPLRTVWNIIKEIGKGIGKGFGAVVGMFSAPAPEDAPPPTPRGGAGAPPGAGPTMFSAAPGMAGDSGGAVATGSPNATGGDTIIFEISGLIGDPDALAAKIEALLDKRAKRTGRRVAVAL